jgi:hypothetical protein
MEEGDHIRTYFPEAGSMFNLSARRHRVDQFQAEADRGMSISKFSIESKTSMLGKRSCCVKFESPNISSVEAMFGNSTSMDGNSVVAVRCNPELIRTLRYRPSAHAVTWQFSFIHSGGSKVSVAQQFSINGMKSQSLALWHFEPIALGVGRVEQRFSSHHAFSRTANNTHFYRGDASMRIVCSATPHCLA